MGPVGVMNRLLALAGECSEDRSIGGFGSGGFKTQSDGLRAKAADRMLLEICG
jgi:hypothetical protein